MTVTRTKLIEVALPLDAINTASAREKSIRHGHPSTLHLWWARRPLAAARAVIFGQLVDDPSSVPEEFPTPEEQAGERERLFGILRELVKWENTGNETVLGKARAEIRRSWRRACADNAEHPRAAELFDPDRLPAFHDPFAGGGSLPLEAQRLGLEAHASDLNPVAVLINKAMIEIPPKFAGRPPVNPEDRAGLAGEGGWPGASGLAADVRYYGRWMRDEASRRIGHLYPKAGVTAAMAAERPDLKPYVGRKLTVIAWLWARTVKSPNPAFADVEVPLASSFVLSSKKGKEAWVEPVIEERGYRFVVKVGIPPEEAKRGTKLSRGSNFQCLMSGSPIAPDFVKSEGIAKRMGARLLAIVAEGDRGRVYLHPTDSHDRTAREAESIWRPEQNLPEDPRNFWTLAYGLESFGDLFTNRQLTALTTFSDLVAAAQETIERDASTAGLTSEGRGLAEGGTDAFAYAQAVGVYLGLGVGRATDFWNGNATWEGSGGFVAHAFTRQAIPMVWDFAESNPFSSSSDNWSDTGVGWIPKVLECLPSNDAISFSRQMNACDARGPSDVAFSTDPPYYDNIGYADLSDFFYVWLRRTLKMTFPDLFATVAVPKTEELVATPYRHGSKEAAEQFFLVGMREAIGTIGSKAHPALPVTIYYAFKQSETKKGESGTASTGWETFLEAVIQSGVAVTGTLPMRTERSARSTSIGTNALASSIVLVGRRRPDAAPLATRRQFVGDLRGRLPAALRLLQSGNIAPVDLAQAAIGPGMAAYTRYAKVLDASGKPMTVREALALINQILDEVLAEQEGDFDADSRWALAWFEEHGFGEGEFGRAETLSKAKVTSVAGMAEAGILVSRAGRVRLLRPEELPANWDPRTDTRLTSWEMVHHLIRVLETKGDEGAARLVRTLGSAADTARELCYRLYALADRKNRAPEALAYNTLVRSWPSIAEIARSMDPVQGEMLDLDGSWN
ncbi:MAG: DUF1156 domain-containing protein [Gammaproteobacteria bacterium]|nr:DUF1156 domain-containing protein [Gammaproteobacteria bacterium]